MDTAIFSYITLRDERNDFFAIVCMALPIFLFIFQIMNMHPFLMSISVT